MVPYKPGVYRVLRYLNTKFLITWACVASNPVFVCENLPHQIATWDAVVFVNVSGVRVSGGFLTGVTWA